MNRKQLLLTLPFLALWPACAHAQFPRRAGPCTDLPELGSFLETQVVSKVEAAPGGLLRYTWQLTLLPGSQRTAISVSLADAAGQFTGPANWGALSGASRVELRDGAIFSTCNLDADTDDLKAPSAYEFGGLSDSLPAPTLMIIYPRRAACEPTDEEWPTLAAKGWTREKLGRLHRLEFYTNREVVIAPVLANTGERSSALFAKAMKRLADLQEYLSPLAEGERSRRIPAPTQDAGEYAGLRMENARQRARERSSVRPQDATIIDALYQFFLSRQ